MDSNIDVSIGTRIKKRRQELHITQREIFQKTGISTGNLSGIECGRYLPSATALIELSKILNCSTDWILKGESLKSNSNQSFDISELEKHFFKLFHELPTEEQQDLFLILQVFHRRTTRLNRKNQRSNSKNKVNEIA